MELVKSLELRLHYFLDAMQGLQEGYTVMQGITRRVHCICKGVYGYGLISEIQMRGRD